MSTQNSWFNGQTHLALVISDIELGKWYVQNVLKSTFVMFRETQIMTKVGSVLMVLKLSKDAVDKTRQEGRFEKQVLDHYGFMATKKEDVDDFYSHVCHFNLPIVKEPYDRSDGRAFYFRDPFGNLVEFLWFNGNL